jgi:hypothetical protein
MKRWLLLVVCGLLSGCDYTVPLVKSPEMDIDKSVVGLWQRTNEQGQSENLVVLPLDAREYLVSYPANSKDGMFARACLCRVGDTTLMQLRWFGTAQGGTPDDNRVYQLAAFTVSSDKLTARLVNAAVVGKDHASSDELAKAILAAKDDPKLFGEEMAFTKVKE